MSVDMKFLDLEDVQGMDLSGLAIYSRYRGVRLLEKGDHETLCRAFTAAAIRAGGVCAAAFQAGQLQAVCAVKPLEWDSRHFGTALTGLTLTAAAGCAGEVLPALLEGALAAVPGATDGIHVSAEVDIDDYECLNALLAVGFEILDIKRSYRWYDMVGIQAPKFRSLVREYAPDDRARVLQLAGESSISSRFSRDRFLAGPKVGELYRLWFEQLLDGGGDNTIALVFERDGLIEACGAIEMTDLSSMGVPVRFMDKGLYVSGPHGVGGYFPVLYELAARSLQKCALAQTSVSLNNHPAVRVLEKMGVGSESVRYALRLYRR